MVLFPANYLGMPLGAKSNSKSKWDKVVEICKSRLSTWKRGVLSKGGRLTLIIKSVLLSLPVYYFSLFVAPISVVKQIESTIRNFLWDDANGGKKHHWVGWKKVSIPRARGGLGIRNLKGMNRALLKKMVVEIGKGKALFMGQDHSREVWKSGFYLEN